MRKDRITAKRLLANFWQLAIGLALGFFGLAWVAWGATYNFYFNNTEQGDNSTASPTLTVTGDGKATGSGAQQSVGSGPTAEKAAAKDAAAPVPGAQSVSTKPEAAAPEQERGEHRWSLVASAAVVGPADEVYNPYGGIVSLGYRVSRDVGVSAFGGVVRDEYHYPQSIVYNDGAYYNAASAGQYNRFVYGGELSLTPIHVALGRVDNLIELGVLAGASNLGESSDQFTRIAHAGARLSLNLGDQWGLTGAVRANAAYKMAEAGLEIRL